MIYANVYAEQRLQNSLFLINDPIHRFNPSYTPRLLRESFLQYGIEINTPDLNVGRTIAFDLYIEGCPIIPTNVPKFLIALENPYINKLNIDFEFYKNFVTAFSWDERLHKLSNVVPIFIPHPMVSQPFLLPQQKLIFACLINANKAFKSTISSDLYLERIKTIRWYERHALDKFELYGLGWDKATPAFDFLGKLKRLIPQIKLKLFHQKPYLSFCGEIADKSTVLRLSKFSYCYENSSDLSNYITEKLFDSLVCGCIPIYWGGKNVQALIPNNCFIDRRNFKDTAEVHAYLLNISDHEYLKYQENIMNYLSSRAALNFNSKHVISTIVQNIIKHV